MTEQQAVQESIEHWKRMIEWVKKQPKKNKINNYEMQDAIKEYWQAPDCSFCENFTPNKCEKCPLRKRYGRCNEDNKNNAWGAVRYDSKTWHDWLIHARVMLEQLESLRECKFKVGNTVEVIRGDREFRDYLPVGKIGKITSILNNSCNLDLPQNMACGGFWLDELRKVEDMSKYDEISSRIDALDDGWNKEADDVLKEIFDSNNKYYDIVLGMGHDSNLYINNSSNKEVATFHYNSQCVKMEVFKEALHWLLDHSDIKKDEKTDKIKEIQDKVDILQKELKELS